MAMGGRWLVVLGVVASLAACERADQRVAASPAAVLSQRNTRPQLERQAPAERLLSYSHSVVLKLPGAKMQAGYESLLSRCQAVPAQGCVVMDSSISSDHWRHAEVQMMIRRDAVAALRADVDGLGTVVAKATRAEDITGPVTDTGRRLAMKKALREDLLVLRKQSHSDIQALLTVTQSLAQVQSDIEAGEAALAHLQERVAMDAMKVELQPEEDERLDAPNPVWAALRDFGSDLAKGAGAFITFVAWSLPWLLLIIALPFVWRGLRRIWRLGRR